MILGIPTYTVIRVFAAEFFYNFKAVQRITSSLGSEYIREENNSREENKDINSSPGNQH